MQHKMAGFVAAAVLSVGTAYAMPGASVAEPPFGTGVILAQAAQPQEARVHVKSAVLRSGPDSKSKKIASLRRGTHVQVLDSSGDWAHVRAGKREGYVLKSLLATSA